MKKLLVLTLIIALFTHAAAAQKHEQAKTEAKKPQADTTKKKKKGFLGGLFGGKKKENERLEAENTRLAEQAAKDKTEKEQLSKQNEQKTFEVTAIGMQKSITDLQKKMLDSEVKQAKATIQGLSVEQAKAELALSRQKAMYDSVSFIATLDSIQVSQQKAVLQQKEDQIARQEAEGELYASQRNLMLAVLSIVGLLALGQYLRFKHTKKHAQELQIKNEIIEKEKQRSDELLLNILPLAIANELKVNGKVHAQSYERVSVLFTDFVGFTKIAEQLEPQELVTELHYCFKNFDIIITKNGLEKIKTIGDAYMCAGGLPNPDDLHVGRMVRAALEIQDFLKVWNAEKLATNQPTFNARIGIHTGHIVAGVVGIKKFVYDIWGDTVNVAARLESASEANKVNISEDTYELVKNEFKCMSRGKISIKNKGEVEMYYVEEALV